MFGFFFGRLKKQRRQDNVRTKSLLLFIQFKEAAEGSTLPSSRLLCFLFLFLFLWTNWVWAWVWVWVWGYLRIWTGPALGLVGSSFFFFFFIFSFFWIKKSLNLWHLLLMIFFIIKSRHQLVFYVSDNWTPDLLYNFTYKICKIPNIIYSNTRLLFFWDSTNYINCHISL